MTDLVEISLDSVERSHQIGEKNGGNTYKGERQQEMVVGWSLSFIYFFFIEST